MRVRRSDVAEQQSARGYSRGQLEDFVRRPRQAVEDYSAKRPCTTVAARWARWATCESRGQTCLLPSRPPRKSAKNMSVPHSSSTWRRKLPCHGEEASTASQQPSGRQGVAVGRGAAAVGGAACIRVRVKGDRELKAVEDGGRRAPCLRAGDEADRLGRHHDGGEVLAVIVLDVDRADALGHHTLDVLLGAATLVLGAANLEGERVLKQVEVGARDARDLLLCLCVGGEDVSVWGGEGARSISISTR